MNPEHVVVIEDGGVLATELRKKEAEQRAFEKALSRGAAGDTQAVRPRSVPFCVSRIPLRREHARASIALAQGRAQEAGGRAEQPEAEHP